MKSPLSLAALAAVVLALTGCGGEKAADPAAIEAAFKDAPADTAAPEAASGEESTTDAVQIGGGAEAEVQVQAIAGRAAAAMRKDDVTEAMVMLQTLRRAKNLSPAQLGAVQDQMAALQMDLANRAANGDQKAQAALKLIGQSTRW